jgi:hypothetical protein
MEETWGTLSFALGGAFLLFGIYFMIGNTDKPWINTPFFTVYFILPLGFISFSLLGWDSTSSSNQHAIRNRSKTYVGHSL